MRLMTEKVAGLYVEEKKRMLYKVVRVISSALAFILVLCIFAGCNKTNEPEIRTDTQPIINRFSTIKNIEKCYWMAGDIGESRILPSPDSWMQGFIMIDENQIDEWREQVEWESVIDANFVTYKYEINVEITGFAKESFSWTMNDDFTEHIMPPYYHGEIFLDMNHGVIYFSIGTS